MIIQAWLWVLDNQPLFWQAVWQHLMMCGLALSIALIIAIPTGVLIANIPRLAFIITSGASTLRTIPSLAILAAVMPFLGIGLLPSVVALVVLAVPPILLNTCTSIQSVNPDTLSAAHGMGLTPWQVTGKIVLPLAAPGILAGCRTGCRRRGSGVIYRWRRSGGFCHHRHCHHGHVAPAGRRGADYSARCGYRSAFRPA
ncbi:ABC transporter permease [Citrobacter koseri]|uniref:ABC transporter permease n=1 Tax=Citrobacter koseri TaxID=545 RepID=UPI001D964136|nr:ABC transporter permease subunit [Citrobacter koseri]CAG0277054.1 Carnitine transport permease protein OpuCB [Citrobacter koseri]CAH6138896.1 Carnitine transport permease protein OpuCB [Citrobacter koseri]